MRTRLLVFAALVLTCSAFPQSISLKGTVALQGTVTMNGGAAAAPGCGASYNTVLQYLLQRATNSDLSDYVYDVVLTDSRFKDVGHGGLINNTDTNFAGITGSPADFTVCDSSSGGTAIPFVVPYWDNVNGVVELHLVKSTLHEASNDAIYVAVGNVSVTTSQQTDFCSTANIVAWWTLSNGSSLSAIDICGSFNGTVNSATATAGVFDGGANFSGSSQNITASLASSAIQNMSMQAWVRTSDTSSLGAAQTGIIVEQGGSGNGWNLAFISGSCSSSNTVNIVLEGIRCDAGGTGFSGALSSGNMQSGWHFVQGGRNATYWFLFGDTFAVSSSVLNMPNTPTTRTTIGGKGDNTTYLTGKVDDVRVLSMAPDQDRAFTTARVGRWNSPGAMLVSTPTYTQPEIRQSAAACYSDGGSALTCSSGFPLTNSGHDLAAAIISSTDNDCHTWTLSSGLGLTYTLAHATNGYSDFSGTLHHYYTCVFFAPITTTGVETVTGSAANSSMIFAEIKDAKTSGLAAAKLTNTAQPSTLTVTSPGSNSLQLCATWGDALTNAQSYPMLWSEIDHPSDHGASTTLAYSIVGTGSQSCSFNAGNTGVLVVLPVGP